MSPAVLVMLVGSLLTFLAIGAVVVAREEGWRVAIKDIGRILALLAVIIVLVFAWAAIGMVVAS